MEASMEGMRTDRVTLQVAIGPLVGEYGGPAQHILGLTRYSSHRFFLIRPSRWSIYYEALG